MLMCSSYTAECPADAPAYSRWYAMGACLSNGVEGMMYTSCDGSTATADTYYDTHCESIIESSDSVTLSVCASSWDQYVTSFCV